MFDQLKNFYKKHQLAISIGLIMVGTSMATYSIAKYVLTKDMISIVGRKFITWSNDPKVGYMDLDHAKEILDANAEVASRFAIFKEGIDPNKYQCIVLSNDFKFGPTMEKIFDEIDKAADVAKVL